MEDSGIPVDYSNVNTRTLAGTITKIRLENFMCHGNLEIELCPWVNFITGQNGSGKSAVLTALCVAFGCRAKGTQRAATLKDFIKTGCSYAVVEVVLRNGGDDAFKHDVYGDVIVIERRITQSASTTVLKNSQGRKVAARKEELRELVDHFNIDVENPCVIMSQDKSREFLHSGNEKDKFKFYFKATLLQQVDDLLQSISEQLNSANALVDELEASIKPIEKELSEIQRKIKNMEHIEEISQQVQRLKKKLAWSWVYSIDKQLQELIVRIGKLKDRVPACQAKIDKELGKMVSLRDRMMKKKIQTEKMVEKTSEVRKKQEELKDDVSSGMKRKHELEQEYDRESNQLKNLAKRLRGLEQQVQDIQEQRAKNTQAEESEMEEKVKELQSIIDAAYVKASRLKEEENAVSERVAIKADEIGKITEEIEGFEKKQNEISSRIRELKLHKTNKVTAFGGDKVIYLLRLIEREQHKFVRPPIGPIGSHLTLANGDVWASAVESAIGKLLNAFIVTEHRDSLLLKRCAAEARYNNLQIIIYDFTIPRLNIPSHMLPQTNHPTTLSAIYSDNDTVLNVLVDMGSAERQVLVKDYDVGKTVAFDQRIANLKEVYTLDGYKMFSRGSVQTVLPPMKNFRTGRLCGTYDDQIESLEEKASFVNMEAQKCRKRKQDSEANLRDLKNEYKRLRDRCLSVEREIRAKKLELEYIKKSNDTETTSTHASTDELQEEILSIQEKIQEKEILLEKFQVRISEAEAKVKQLKLLYNNFCDSAKEEFEAFEEAERELMKIEKDLQSAEAEKEHYEKVMANKVLHDIKIVESQYRELEETRKESCRKASIICSESEIETLGGWDGSSPEQLSAQLNRMNQRLQNEAEQCSDPIDDLRMMYEKKERKIFRKRETYKVFREKLRSCQEALDLRWNKFQRNATLLKRQLTWNFNGHLGKKGISGNIKVSYEDRTLGVEVKMPQDASSSTVRDTKGLSGGERSFSTLCFALSLHQMIEAPFRAMDEFDVFMDAVSRKISMKTLVDFAVGQGSQSQWIFITPHDVSMVESGERIKKQLMAAPRS